MDKNNKRKAPCPAKKTRKKICKSVCRISTYFVLIRTRGKDLDKAADLVNPLDTLLIKLLHHEDIVPRPTPFLCQSRNPLVTGKEIVLASC